MFFRCLAFGLVLCVGVTFPAIGAESNTRSTTASLRTKNVPIKSGATKSKPNTRAAIDISEDSFSPNSTAEPASTTSEANNTAMSQSGSPSPAGVSGKSGLPPGAMILIPPPGLAGPQAQRGPSQRVPTAAATPIPSGAYTSDAAGNKIYDNGAVVPKGATEPVFSGDPGKGTSGDLSPHLKQVGTGGHNDASNGDRTYDDGTVVDAKGMIKSLPGARPGSIPQGISLRSMNNYLSMHPGASLAEAIQAIKSGKN